MTQVQEVAIRGEAIDSAIKQLIAVQYKFKQAVTISDTAAWQNSFYQETTISPLTAASGNPIRAVPRLANPPTNSVDWNRINSWQEKYMFEDVIAWEDIITNNIDVQARTVFRVAEAIAKAVDDQIYTALTDTVAQTTLNTINIAATKYWDGTSAAIIDDLAQARQLIAEDGYDTSNLMAFITPKDMRSIVNYLAGKGAQFPTIGQDVATNGRQGKLVGIDLVVANNVTASQAIIVIPKLCATWKTAVPLQTNVTENPFVSLRIRAVEIGVTHVTDPRAMCKIMGTQGNF